MRLLRCRDDTMSRGGLLADAISNPGGSRLLSGWLSEPPSLLAVLFVACHLAGATASLSAQSVWDSSEELPQRMMQLVLPTENDALFSDDGPAFYQYTDRRMQPGIAPAWEGGKYGFVRNFRVTRYGPVYTRFHEGIDIRSVERASERQEPRDLVRSIDDGVVVYVNNTSAHSSYGRYVVVEHWWSGSPFYSLYAHLGRITANVGQDVSRGQALGVMGYSGVGINRRRAHLHLEVNLMLSRNFQDWYDENFADNDKNHHGIYNGMNLAGMDVAELYMQARQDPSLSIRQFVAGQDPFFAVTAPAAGMPDMLWRYPWLSPDLEGWSPMFGSLADFGSALEITFSRSGMPLRFEALDREVTATEVRVLNPSPMPYQYLTGGLVRGSGDQASLSASGRRHVSLLLRTAPDLRGTSW